MGSATDWSAEGKKKMDENKTSIIIATLEALADEAEDEQGSAKTEEARAIAEARRDAFSIACALFTEDDIFYYYVRKMLVGGDE